MLILNETTLFFFELTSNVSPQVNTSGVVLNWASKVASARLQPDRIPPQL